MRSSISMHFGHAKGAAIRGAIINLASRDPELHVTGPISILVLRMRNIGLFPFLKDGGH
jgi:hypothetical protein